MNKKHECYLGDGVYAEYDGYQIKLYTDDGFRPTNTIYLEPQVLDRFEKWVDQLKESLKSPKFENGAVPDAPGVITNGFW